MCKLLNGCMEVGNIKMRELKLKVPEKRRVWVKNLA
jgi:hypothetical protein